MNSRAKAMKLGVVLFSIIALLIVGVVGPASAYAGLSWALDLQGADAFLLSGVGLYWSAVVGVVSVGAGVFVGL